MKYTYVFYFLCILFSQCNSQCLSEDDTATRKASTDLSGITDFGLELFRTVFPYNETRNFFFSPYSIWNALALAYFGAEGETARQLEKVLRVKNKVDAIMDWKELQFIYNMRGKENSGYTFNLENRAYFDQSVHIRPCLHDILGETIQKLDFGKPQEAAKTINDLVSKTTKGRITQIVKPNDISMSRMALINAAFFKGTWKFQFKKRQTKNQLFYAAKDKIHMCKMMTQKGNFRSGPVEALGAHMLELPYSSKRNPNGKFSFGRNEEDISMLILMPPFTSGEEGFNNMISKITGPVLHEAVESLWRGKVIVTLPKFKLEQSIGNELIDSLVTMGVTDLFDSTAANLTSFDPRGALNVGESLHLAKVEVNEEGTEAAAATSLVEFRVARPDKPEEFKCDHPFLFILFDNVTKNILFMGAYKNPVE